MPKHLLVGFGACQASENEYDGYNEAFESISATAYRQKKLTKINLEKKN